MAISAPAVISTMSQPAFFKIPSMTSESTRFLAQPNERIDTFVDMLRVAAISAV